MRKPSAATAIACLALFFSLGGAGLAVVHQGSGLSTYNVTRSARIPGHRGVIVAARCHHGDTVLGGGFDGVGALLSASRPRAGGWMVQAVRDPNYPADQGPGQGPTPTLPPTAEAWVVCAGAQAP